MIHKLFTSSPKCIDLTNTDHSNLVEETANNLLKEYSSVSELNTIEDKLIGRSDESMVFPLLALKIAKSKIIIKNITKPLTVSVVFAVYKEHNRIKTKNEHPFGEDFLLKKVSQLNWLFNEQALINWELIVVDDGCPNNSGRIAQDIISKKKLNNKVKVLFLEDAIKQKLSPVKNISTSSESQKGGSIIYGMWQAIQQNENKDHIVVYTDADLSTHLGQIGLLIKPIIYNKKYVAIGSRREPKSVVIKKTTRNNRGKLFIYLWKRLIPNLGDIIDTQCGFKAFHKEVLLEIIDNLIEMKFSFDIELLLKAELFKNQSITKVPIAWIDSEAESTTTDIQPYLPMLKKIVLMYKKYFPVNTTSNEFASFIESLNTDGFNRILDNIPLNITQREPYEFTEYDEVNVSELSLNI